LAKVLFKLILLKLFPALRRRFFDLEKRLKKAQILLAIRAILFVVFFNSLKKFYFFSVILKFTFLLDWGILNDTVQV
jgi:hypothetical protein